MFRLFVFLGSVLLTFVSISTAGFAADLGELRFTLSASSASSAQVGFDLTEVDGRHRERVTNNSTMPVRDLIGLVPGELLGRGNRPLRFALVRESGRADCAGAGGEGRASGRCTFTPDGDFQADLAQAGIAPPSRREAFGMMLLNVRRELVAAVRDAGYRNPTVNELTGLAALGITPTYIRELDQRGYRPNRLGDPTAFKALGVTPEYVDGLVRAGFGRIAPDEIVQLKALGVSPAYLAQLRAVGYAPFRSSEVVQMRALGITASDYARFRQAHGRVDVDRLVQAKALGFVDRGR
jgi:hypothetical protein